MVAPVRLASFLPSLLLACCTAVGIAETATAQTQEQQERLYAVELVVFARDGGAFEEIWPDSLALRYPDRARQLARLDGPATPPLPLWTALDRGTQQLGNAARAIERQNGMRVLFHERWLQPAQWQGRPAPIAVNGGTPVGAHHELAGYVTLRVGRFLHIDTNLWLAEFGARNATRRAEQSRTGQENIEQEVTPPFRLPEPPPAHAVADAQTKQVSTRTLLAAEQRSDGATGSIAADPLAELPGAPLAAPQVQPSQIVTLTQQRRVRFGELHYFDHPRFGAIVQVTDHKPEPATTAPEPAAAGTGTVTAQPAVNTQPAVR